MEQSGIQENLSQLGLARADLAQAGLLANPNFSLLFPLGPKQLEFAAAFPIEAVWLERAAWNCLATGQRVTLEVGEAHTKYQQAAEALKSWSTHLPSSGVQSTGFGSGEFSPWTLYLHELILGIVAAAVETRKVPRSRTLGGELLLPLGNTLSVTREVEAALDALKPGLKDLEVDSTIFRPATFIERSLGNLQHALLLGCGLVVIVLVAFFFEWRAALISLITIPLSLLAAAIVLHYLGGTINTMVPAGLVIAGGVVVDDAIIDVENVARRLRLNRMSAPHFRTDSKRTVALVTTRLMFWMMPSPCSSGLEVRRPSPPAAAPVPWPRFASVT